MKDPILEVKDLLDTNWDTANTSISYQPDIHTGWVDNEASTPQITVSHPDEGPIFGASTPFSGFDPTGGGPVQDISGMVSANSWSSWAWEPNENPKKLTYEFSEEVKRIIKNNTLQATDLQYVGYGGRRFFVDRNAEPTVFRYQTTVRYGYRERP